MNPEEAVKTITDIVAENARLEKKLAAAAAELAFEGKWVRLVPWEGGK